MKHHTTPALLAVVAVLLALNLAAALPWPTAQAQDEPQVWPPPPVPEPHVVAWELTHATTSGQGYQTTPVILRQWSDGVVEVARYSLVGLPRQPPCADNPFGSFQPCLSEWVVFQEFTP